MRMSRMFAKTLREAPSGADSKGYEYLLRAGFINQMGAGLFTLLPFGFRSNEKIEQIIKEEMDAIGAEQMQMPVVNTGDIWKKTGRYYSIDREMTRFQDRAGRDMVLAMTHEEAVTDCALDEIDSYKKLPMLVYQIQTKWRDDPRPRAGLIRVREFTMLDSYSFDKDWDGLDKVYGDHYRAYFRIFGRCGLPVVAVGADSGMMGGKISHEYMYLNPIGEDTIIHCDACGYTANRQVAKFKKIPEKEEMKPMEKVKTPACKTIEDLCAFLHIGPEKTAKAVFMVGTFINDKTGEEVNKLIVAIVRGDMDVEENKLQNAVKANSLRPAHVEEIAAGGMVPGFGSPIHAHDDVVKVIDDLVAGSNNLVAGANEEGCHFLNTNYGRDYTGIVADIASAKEGYICPKCGKPLHSDKGIEAGNIFQLGTRYSDTMGLSFQDESGARKSVVMGSYGIGVGRLLACLAEEYHDEKGLKLPITVAPYTVELLSLVKDPEVGEKIYDELTKAGIDVLYDDRKESAGIKFADADLIGIPVRITVGNRSLKEGKAEVKVRSNLDETMLFDLSDLTSETKNLIAKLTKEIEDKVPDKKWIKNVN